MKKVLVIGSNGLVGGAVADALAESHEVVRASRSEDERVDISDPASVRELFERVGPLDAVVCCAGVVPFKPIEELTWEDYRAGFENKVLGQISLVTEGLSQVRDGGSFTFITGILAREPIATGAAASAVNGALESFVMAAATELPRGVRINAVSPSVLSEADGYHPFFPGYPHVPAAEVARAYVRSVDGVETGKTFRV